jgi:hypothetical protein
MIDKTAFTRWQKAAISYENYMKYLRQKRHIHSLSLVDLLYVSNFKGGNASIHEPEHTVNDKLVYYSTILDRIFAQFGKRNLIDLDDKEIIQLSCLVDEAFDLTYKTTYTKIDGFSDSYVTALLHFHFPELIPILDRRLLNNLNLLTDIDIDSYGQVKNIRRFFRKVVTEFRRRCLISKQSIRELDKEIFSRKISPNHIALTKLIDEKL